MPTVFVLVALFFGDTTSILGVFTHRELAEPHLQKFQERAKAGGINVEYDIEEHEVNKLFARVC